jgi:hypothetical protein
MLGRSLLWAIAVLLKSNKGRSNFFIGCVEKVFVCMVLKLNSWAVNSMNFWIKPRIGELFGWNWL